MDQIYISPGNIRMDFPTFSLPAVTSCPNHTVDCGNYCYAKKAEKLYPGVLPSRIRNLNESKRNTFVKIVSDILSKRQSKYIRIHESGDFYSQEYLDKWFEICRKFPDKKFLAYTQCYNLDYSKKPSNLVLYWSIWPDSRGLPETGLKAFVVDSKHKYLTNMRSQAYVARNGFKCMKGHGSKVKCNTCLHCFEGKGDVIFEIH